MYACIAKKDITILWRRFKESVHFGAWLPDVSSITTTDEGGFSGAIDVVADDVDIYKTVLW
jgi:hypothetical protein